MYNYRWSKNFTIKKGNIMENKILVETSARHIHLTKEHVDILFGAGHQLTVKRCSASPDSSRAKKK